MEKESRNLYKLPNIERYEDIDLLTLSETCYALEERVYQIIQTLPEQSRLVVEDYIRTRDDLELETFKTALRWGKKHYK